MSRIRIIFSKTGLATYINHQDLPIIFSRSLKRTGVNLEFTQGFSPHPRLSFSVALAIGVEGKAEVADFWVEDETVQNISRINDFLPEGFRVLDYFEIHNDFLLGKQIKAANYDLAFKDVTLAQKAQEILCEKLTEENALVRMETKENVICLTVLLPERFSASYFVKQLKENEIISGWQDIKMTRNAIGKIDEVTNEIMVPRS
ncbi:MAG: TIGR03936 family radical SAM-associated protein [Synergistaceae bacterium]|nr:TIGR03936 family radical SAM-associated protein [Synergistaceae bacterium]